MRSDQTRGISRADAGRATQSRIAGEQKGRRRRAALEALEARTLLATLPSSTAVVLPAPTVEKSSPFVTDTNYVNGQGNAIAPSIAVNPANPNQVVAVYTVDDSSLFGTDTPVQVQGRYSTDGGQTWATFRPTRDVGVHNVPFNGTNVVPFGVVSDGAVAWDRQGNFYVLQNQHAEDNHAGEIFVSRYTLTGGAPAFQNSSMADFWNTSGSPNPVGQVAYQPTIAVDGNVSTAVGQADPFAANSASINGNSFLAGSVYVAYAINVPEPTGDTSAPYNPYSIDLTTSSDGAQTFPNPFSALHLGDGHDFSYSADGSPQLTVSQGTASGSVKSGQVTLVYDDYGAVESNAGIPGDIIKSQAINGGATSAGTPTRVAISAVRGPVGLAPVGGNPLVTAADPQGIAPAPVIASDNTLGALGAAASFAGQHEGRIYVAFTSLYSSTLDVAGTSFVGGLAGGNDATNTDVFVYFSDNGGASWTPSKSAQLSDGLVHPLPINDDRGTIDGYSDATLLNSGRSQFEPALAVDQTTGTLGVTFLDERYDSGRARVATTMTTSIDGGRNFSDQDGAFANDPNTAVDEISGKVQVLGPIPENDSSGNPSRDGTYGFGNHQGLAFSAGHLLPIYISDEDGGLVGTQAAIPYVSYALTSVGPRVISGTMGVVGEPTDRVNTARNADGSPVVNSFVVTFDRPVQTSTFTTLQAVVRINDQAGQLVASTDHTGESAGVSSSGDRVPIVNVVPLNATNGLATQFEVVFGIQGVSVPEVATYEYAVGPGIRDAFNDAMDQNGDAVAGEQGTAAGTYNDSFSTPAPASQDAFGVKFGVPFGGPFDRTTLPLTTPGPHVVAAQAYSNSAAVAIPANGSASSTIAVAAAATQQVTGVTVDASITIAHEADLTLSLVAPDGTVVALYQGAGTGANFSGTRFSDASAIAGGAAPLGGVYYPATPLSALNGHLAAGTWTLRVVNGSGDAGSITGFGLHISTTTVALDSAITQVPIVFDRDMSAASISAAVAAGTVQVVDPEGVVYTKGFAIAASPAGQLRSFVLTIGTNADGTPTIPNAATGSYKVILPSTITSAAGDALDTDLNGGLSALEQGTATTLAKEKAATLAYTNPASTPISAGTQSSTITVPAGDTYLIKAGVQVGLTINLTSGVDSNLTAYLITPQIDPTTNLPYRILLFSGVGNSGTKQGFSGTLIYDAAATPISSGTAPFTSPGGYQPQASLDTPLVGQSAAGTYTLQIVDASGGTVGALTSWSLTFNKAVLDTGLGEPVADEATIPFRVFNLNPTSAVSSSAWAPVGPAGIAAAEKADTNGAAAGRVNAVAVDPADPSGNTVYAGGASGGVWKTTDFLTTSPSGPTWTPLTDFGPAFGANIGSIAVFDRNGDPNQSVIFALTGEGDALGDPTQAAQARGVGVLRSADGGRTWTLLDSTNNTLPFVQRDHRFAVGSGTTGFKIVVDPSLSSSGGIVVYMAISDVDGSGRSGGVWRSLDGGLTWGTTLNGVAVPNLAGQATDVTLDLNSGTGTINGNLQILYAAIEGSGVYQSPNQGQSWSLMLGTAGDPLIQEGSPSRPVPVGNLGTTVPNGAKGRIVLARPSLTGSYIQDKLYQGWLYAAVVSLPQAGSGARSPNGQFDGLYMTKDYGQNWVRVTLPADSDSLPSRDTADANVTLTGSRTPAGNVFGLGNFDLSLTVDPSNPNVVYVGGTNEYQSTGLIRVDTTAINDAHAFYSSTDLEDGGAVQTASSGGAVESNPGVQPQQYMGVLQPRYYQNHGFNPTLNLIRDPSNLFAAGSTVLVANVASFANSGADVKWIPLDTALQANPFESTRDSSIFSSSQALQTRGQHQVVALVDPTTGQTRLIFADDQGIYSAVANVADGTLIGSIGGLRLGFKGDLATDQGNQVIPSGSRNGDLQIAQLYSAAAQPSTSAADQSSLPGFFYGNTSETGQPQSDVNEVDVTKAGLGYGNLSWSGDSAVSTTTGNPVDGYFLGSGTGVGVDQTGSGTVYQFKWPSSLDDQFSPTTDFFQVNGISKTSGLVQTSSGDGDVPDTQWPFRAGSLFAVNPVRGSQVLMSSQAGRVFRTENSGDSWSVIANPSDLDGTYAPAVAFGAPDPTGPLGPGNLDNFLYAGTTGGNVYETQVGGGVNNSNAWVNTTPLPQTNDAYYLNPAVAGGLDGSPVEQISTDPTRGSHDAYVVTAGGVSFSAPNYDHIFNDGPPTSTTPENTISKSHPTGREEVYIDKDVDISRLTVTANVSATNIGQLTLELIAPDGSVHVLSSGFSSGAAGPAFTNTTFDDDASSLLSNGVSPYTGTFLPTNGTAVSYLSDRYHLDSDFYGKNIRGTWTLEAIGPGSDNFNGTVNSWSLNYTTLGGVYFNPNTTSVVASTAFISGPDSSGNYTHTTATTYNWQEISGDLYTFKSSAFGSYNRLNGIGDAAVVDESDTTARSLTSIVADYRYAVPDSKGVVHPILYVGGDSGVFQSIDGGTTWTKFPAASGLPQVRVTGLSLAYGEIDPNTGRPIASASDPDLLTASTYGRGEFAIELSPIVLTGVTLGLDATAPTAEPTGAGGLSIYSTTGRGSDTGNSATDRLTADAHPFITGFSQQTAFGSTVTVNLYDGTAATGSSLGNLVGTGTTDSSGHFSVQVTGTLTQPSPPSKNGDPIRLFIQGVGLNGAVGQAVPFTFTLDTSAPVAPPAPALEASSNTGRNPALNITNDTSPVFDVSNVEPDARLLLLRDGVVVATIADVGAAGGTIAIQDPGIVPDGAHGYTAIQYDYAGNPSLASATTTVTINTSTPATLQAPVLLPTSDSGKFNSDRYTNSTSPTFAVSTVQSHAELQLLRNGVVVATIADVGAAGGTVNVQDPGPVQPDGVYVYTAVEINQANTASPPSPGTTVTVDTTPPAAPATLVLDPASDSGVKGDGVTNVNDPTFDVSGIEANDTVYLQRASATGGGGYATVATAFVAAGGSITLQDLGPVPDGYYNYRVYQVDLAGNQGPPLASSPATVRILSGTPAAPGPLTLDAASDSGESNSDSYTSATIVTFPVIDVANIIVGSTVYLYRNGVLVNTVANSPGGTIKISDPMQPFNDGVYTYTAKQTDAAGDTSALSGALAVTIDNTPPATPGLPKLEAGSDSGAVGDNVTNNTSPIFDITGIEPKAEVELIRDGAVVASVTYAAGGTVSLQDPGPVAPGVHSYSAIQFDLAGNPSPVTGGVNVTILTTGPTFVPSTPTLTAASDSGASNADDVTNVTSPVLNVATVQANVAVQLIRYSAGVATVVGTRVGPGNIQDPGPLADGYYAYAAREVDAAGNAGATSGLLIIQVDTTVVAPPAPVLEPASDSGSSQVDGVTRVTRPVFDVAGEAASTFTLYRNGVVAGTRTGPGPIVDSGPGGAGLADGTYAYRVVQLDLAGNLSGASPSKVVTVVTSVAAPSAPALAGAPGVSYTNNPRPTLAIASAPAGSTVLLYRNNLLVGSRAGAGTIVDPGTTGAGLPSGTYTYTAYATDAAGNVSVASAPFSLTIATSLGASPAPVLDPASDSGTAGDGITNVSRPTFDVTTSAPQVTVNLVRKPAGAPDSAYAIVGSRTGSGTIQDAGGGAGLADGTYVYATTQSDPAGNASGPGAAVAVTIRTAPPVATAAPTLDPSSDSSPGKGGAYTNSTSPTLDVTGSTPGAPVGVAVVLYRKPAGAPDSAYVGVLGKPAAAGVVQFADGGLTQGAYTYATRQIDVAGNVGPLSPSTTITILTNPPATPTVGLSPATDTGTLGDGVTSSRSPVVVGVAAANATVVLVNGRTGASLGVARASATGAYAVAISQNGSTTFADGTIPVVAYVVDPAGNVGRAPGRLTLRIATVAGDYSGDGRADLATFGAGVFHVAITGGGATTTALGAAGDVPVQGDFDGDGRDDLGVFRPSTGQWIINQTTAGQEVVQFGAAGDVPVPGDYDGDGRTDVAVFRPSTGQWLILGSSGGPRAVQFGTSGDVPVPADYDGDGTTDVGVYRPSTGQWLLQQSTAGPRAVSFGTSTDVPVPADYDGDGRADVAFYRPAATSLWAILQSSGGSRAVNYGTSVDAPVPADYDGDGKADVAFYRSSANPPYFAIQPSAGGSRIQNLGSVGDVPVTALRGVGNGTSTVTARSIARVSTPTAAPAPAAAPTTIAPADAAGSARVASTPAPAAHGHAHGRRAVVAATHARRVADRAARHHDAAIEAVAESTSSRRRDA